MTYAINSTTAGIALGLATQNPAEVLPGAYVTNKTASLGGDAIYGSSAAAWTITNYGTVRTTTGTGIDLRSGGSITNAAAGSITGNLHGIDIRGGLGTVTNNATITGLAGSHPSQGVYIGDGVFLEGGGSVTNNAAGLIAGHYRGIDIAGSAGTVVNSGTIVGSAGKYTVYQTFVGAGVQLEAGGSVVNNAGATISGHYQGVELGGLGTVTNLGTITGHRAGIYLHQGGTIVNSRSGSSIGSIYGYEEGIRVKRIDASPPTLTLINSGYIISPGFAIDMPGGGVVTNTASGLIEGSIYGMNGDPRGTVVNLGTIFRSGYAVSDLQSVTNGATNFADATITGGVRAGTVDNFGIITGGVDALAVTVHPNAAIAGGFGVRLDPGGTLVSSGAISGSYGTAIENFVHAPSTGISVILDPTATEQGRIVGSSLNDTLELRNGDTAGNVRDIASFHQITVDPGATWTVGIQGGAQVVTGNGDSAPLIFEAGGTIDFSELSGFSTIEFANFAPDAATLVDGNFTAVSSKVITVTGGDFGNTFDASAVTGSNEVVLNGGLRADVLTGGAGTDTLTGGGGNDTLNGGGGLDTMTGGAGNDTYVVDNPGDIVAESAGGGIDTVKTTLLSYTLGANLENLTFTGFGNFGGTGNALNNVITGGAGNDTLNGAAGADTMAGGAGNDTYIVDNAGDVVTENPGAGTDTVNTKLLSYMLPANVENLTFVGVGSFAGTGNGLNNVITGGGGNDTLTGGAGNDTLRGGGGADTMTGGIGNDTYSVTDAGDIVTEAAGAGTDTVNTTLLSYTLPANVENLTFIGTGNFAGTGNALNNVITGGAGDDMLTGGAGNDTLRGGAGVDKMLGGAGNDLYIVVNTGDVVTENVNAGTDAVDTPLSSYSLTANVENLTFTGTGNFSGTGNGLNNVITGGAGNDTLTGGAGNDTLNGAGGIDTMAGGPGNDTYIVDNAGDVATENANAGVDTIKTGLLSYTLPDNVENLVFTGLGPFIGTGNALNNAITGGVGIDTLTGGAGDDTLDGGLGPDRMAGGAGNDTYVVDDPGDAVTENRDEGTDTIRTALPNYVLVDNVENLTYTGAGDFTGTGNVLDNVVTGGVGNDVLDGGDGNDTLAGGFGNDILTDAIGQNSFLFNTAPDPLTNVDAITDFVSGTDKILLDHTVFTAFGSSGLPRPLMPSEFADVQFFAETASTRIVYDSLNGSVSYDPDGLGGVTPIRFADLTGQPTIASGDFTIV